MLPDPRARDCLKCKHCYIDGGHSAYSDVTPSTPLEFQCLKGHWNLRRDDIGKRSLDRVLRTAVNCKDYEEEEKP